MKNFFKISMIAMLFSGLLFTVSMDANSTMLQSVSIEDEQIEDPTWREYKLSLGFICMGSGSGCKKRGPVGIQEIAN